VAPNLIDGREVGLDPAGEQTFKMAQDSLLDCFSNHKSCSPLESTLLPSFAINVGPLDGSREPLLVENDGTLLGSYVTLSYCWGGPQTLQLVRSSKEGLKKCIVLDRSVKSGTVISHS